MSVSKKVIGNKKETSKTVKELDLINLTEEQILDMDMEKLNLSDLLKNNKALQSKLTTKKGSKDKMYNNIPEDKEARKNFRTKIRKERNTILENVITSYQLEDKEVLKTSIKSFLDFYKKEYVKNDFEITSLARLNSDKNTLTKIKIVLKIVKDSKIK